MYISDWSFLEKQKEFNIFSIFQNNNFIPIQEACAIIRMNIEIQNMALWGNNSKP